MKNDETRERVSERAEKLDKENVCEREEDKKNEYVRFFSLNSRQWKLQSVRVAKGKFIKLHEKRQLSDQQLNNMRIAK